MKFFAVALILATTFITPYAISDGGVIRIDVGNERDKSNRHLVRRVRRLERAVRQLQNRVFELEADRSRPAPVTATTCYIETAFHGTIMATEPTETAAKAKALKLCNEKTSSGLDCKSSRVKCGK